MLTVAPRGICAMFQEEYCLWVNQTGQVQTQICTFPGQSQTAPGPGQAGPGLLA